MSLIFYTRSNCDLCSKAYALITLGGLADQIKAVDIDEDLELIQRYGNQVPVVLNEQTGEKLSWPFTASQIQELAESTPSR